MDLTFTDAPGQMTIFNILSPAPRNELVPTPPLSLTSNQTICCLSLFGGASVEHFSDYRMVGQLQIMRHLGISKTKVASLGNRIVSLQLGVQIKWLQFICLQMAPWETKNGSSAVSQLPCRVLTSKSKDISVYSLDKIRGF